jgi:hypothetical protein
MAIKLIPATNDLNSIVTQINTNLLDLKNNEVTTVIKDDTGTRRVLLGKGADGFYGIKVSKVGNDVYSAADDDLIFSSSFNNESIVPIHYWFGSYKLSSSYTSLNGSYISINFDDWKGYDWYFESTIFTDAGTGYVQLYNVTDGAAVSGSEFTTTAIGEANAEYYRSAALTKPTGTKVFKVQVKIVGGNGTTQYINAMKSNMVFRTGE